MHKQIELSWNHGNVDRAMRRLMAALRPEARGDELGLALDDLGQALSGLFRSESAAAEQATAMFGRGIVEVDQLLALRSRLLSLLHAIPDAPDREAVVFELQEAFDAYRGAEWNFVRSYGGLMTPGAEGA